MHIISGIGVMSRADGTVLKGTWLKNVLHGRVITTLHDGTKLEEMWHNGKKKASKDLMLGKGEGKSPMDSMEDLINGTGSKREETTNKSIGKCKGNKKSSEEKRKKKRKKKILKQKNQHTSNTKYVLAPSSNIETEEKLNPTEMVDVGL
mmetsp:Transcript_17603/g.24579  ORF Transcript_17603/g.24579 Transcript_17603/m.24579 type:complete len:149 (+) Transcript_17603:776-1222(+)